MTSPIDTTKDKALIKMLYDVGERDKAIELEQNFYKINRFDVGSVICEEHLRKFITQDADMLILKDSVRILAPYDYPVLILGETGTGKELIARALHGSRLGKFIAINCTSLPDELIESELFGHVKGAFTGAIIDRVGKFQEAHNGSIFLDEIGDMPLNMQTKLLRVIQENIACRVGDNKEYPIKCRFICATNQGEDQIRDDLYWRLSVFKLKTKSLRERGDDWKLIAKNLDKDFPIEEATREINKYNDIVGNVRHIEQLVIRWKLFNKIIY